MSRIISYFKAPVRLHQSRNSVLLTVARSSIAASLTGNSVLRASRVSYQVHCPVTFPESFHLKVEARRQSNDSVRRGRSSPVPIPDLLLTEPFLFRSVCEMELCLLRRHASQGDAFNGPMGRYRLGNGAGGGADVRQQVGQRVCRIAQTARLAFAAQAIEL